MTTFVSCLLLILALAVSAFARKRLETRLAMADKVIQELLVMLNDGTEYPGCPECGGEVLLTTGPGRLRQRVSGQMAMVPDDFQIPTCTDCGHESMVPEIAIVLDRMIESNA